MLEQSTNISTIVMKSQAGARRTIESYLKMPIFHNFKFVIDVQDDPMLLLLKKLEQVVKQIGGNVVAIYNLQRSKLTKAEKYEMEDWMAETLGHLLENDPPKPTEFSQLHIKLGKYIYI